MGWASFREDIEERFEVVEKSLSTISDHASQPGITVDWPSRFRSLISEVRSIRTSLIKLLDTATEPHLDLVVEVSRLRTQCAALAHNSKSTKELEYLLFKEQTRRVQLQNELKAWQDRYSRARSELAKLRPKPRSRK